MEKLWKTRLKRYQKMLLKYLRYVLNDHFIIALLFILGAFAWNYSNFLKSVGLTNSLDYTKWLIVIGLLVLLHLGKYATLLEDADIVFLVPREYQMQSYLKKAYWHSVTITLGQQLLCLIILFPYFMIILGFSLFQIVCIVLVQLLLKTQILRYELLAASIARLRENVVKIAFVWLIPAICLSLAIIWGWLGILITVMYILSLHKLEKRNMTSTIAWKYLIMKENQRMLSLYRFFNLFTDVPFISRTAKRRKYLDFILPQKPVYTFLYARSLVRNSEFSELWLRLTVLGTVILYFISNFMLSCILALIFNYLIGFQMFPLEKKYENIVFTHLYPIEKKVRERQFSRLLMKILVFTNVFFAISVLVATKGIYDFILMIIILVIEDYLLVVPYLKWYRKKHG